MDTLSNDEIVIVERRLRSAVCAFGGVLGQGNYQRSNVSSIFRTKGGPHAINAGPPKKKPWQINYEKQLPLRYYDNDNRLSWDVEEHPPVEISENEGIMNNRYGKVYGSDKRLMKKDMRSGECKIVDDDKGIKGPSTSSTLTASSSRASDQSKTKYKCKLCGQPKQKIRHLM